MKPFFTPLAALARRSFTKQSLTGNHPLSCSFAKPAITGKEDKLSQAIQCLKSKTKEGDANAQRRLGRCYLIGTGVQKDPWVAIGLFQAAAEQGDAESQAQLGEYYLKNMYVEQDTERGISYLAEAAKQGHAGAVRHLTVAAKQGHVEAQETLDRLMSSPAPQPPLASGISAAFFSNPKNIPAVEDNSLELNLSHAGWPNFRSPGTLG